MAGYFAKEQETAGFIRCTQLRMDMNAQQVIFLNQYALYVNAKSNILYRELQSSPSIPDWPGIGDRAAAVEIGRGDIYWKQATEARQEAVRLAAVSDTHCRNDIWED